jgi:hypothetical protein
VSDLGKATGQEGEKEVVAAPLFLRSYGMGTSGWAGWNWLKSARYEMISFGLGNGKGGGKTYTSNQRFVFKIITVT